MPIALKPFILAAALLPVLVGCALTPDNQRPAVTMPEQWQAADIIGAGTAIVTADWWQRFDSGELNDLMHQALAANLDVAAAMARIEQARASARSAGASRLPAVEAGAAASRSHTNGSSRDNSQAELSVGYELDLWGGNAATARAAEARFAASVYDLDAVRLVLQSELAASYFRALALKNRLAIAEENLAAAQQLLALVQVLFDNGAATALELAQQRTSVFNIEAELPALRQQLQQTQHALAVLLGRPPQGFRIAGESLSALQLPAVAAGQPATLLERRPDIRRAEAQLQAANADIGAARAALYPSVRLSAASGVSGFLSGGSTSIATLAASLAQTIFDGGRLQGQVAQSQARRTELAAQYVQAVLTSFREVEDSLVAVQANAARAAALTQSAAQAQRAYQLAVARYEAGAHDLLNLLDSQRSRLQAQDSLVQAELARYTATVDLFKALGGGWQSPANEMTAAWQQHPTLPAKH